MSHMLINYPAVNTGVYLDMLLMWGIPKKGFSTIISIYKSKLLIVEQILLFWTDTLNWILMCQHATDYRKAYQTSQVHYFGLKAKHVFEDEAVTTSLNKVFGITHLVSYQRPPKLQRIPIPVYLKRHIISCFIFWFKLFYHSVLLQRKWENK